MKSVELVVALKERRRHTRIEIDPRKDEKVTVIAMRIAQARLAEAQRYSAVLRNDADAKAFFKRVPNLPNKLHEGMPLNGL